ncbi:YoaK family protein [Tardiphaga sp.]|uniref:YoaK family protein n=1 Tax=Tardiphaga sp. TaxID=1926292 RepID=UPI0026341C29|nr:YoaK family protein [Tardiphaga sp.]MDB5618438.1 hypothetical protein [Tardiphaga sp.]
MLTSRSNLLLACALSGLAGYVDGIGFLHLGGLFVSFMSGNSTRLGVMAAEQDWPKAIEALRLIALFVVGAGIGSLIGRGRGRHRQWLLLLAEAVLLGSGALAFEISLPALTIVALVVTMGLENAVFQAEPGAPGIGLTYMTGTLVRVGQLLAAALVGGPRWAWLPNLLLWAALVAGAAIGALAYQRISLASVWFAAAVALLLSTIAAIASYRARI